MDFIELFDETPCVSQSTLLRLFEYALESSDVVFARKGSVDRCAFIKKSPLFLGSDAIRVRIKRSIDPLFAFYFFHSFYVKNYLVQNAYGTTMAGLNESILSSVEICFPKSISEQMAIAAALSDADGYIAALEKLIAKKRLIKQGAMQELLTGKRRLPGFEGEWAEKKLGELLQYEQPQTYIVASTEYAESGIPVLTAGKSLVLGYTNEKTGIYDNLPVIIFDDFTTESKFITYRFKVKSSAMKLLTSTGLCDIRLVYALMQMINFPLKDHQRYWISEYSKIDVKIPLIKAEQTAIAVILSDMDAEIAALEKTLNKARLVKQGMMQELLTGRIRLTEQETETVATPKIVELPKREPKVITAQTDGHNQQFDDAVMIAGIVNALYSNKFPLGRKKVQKCLYLLRRHQDESTVAFKKHAAGPYADEIRYKGGEPIARSAKYITTTTSKGKGTKFARGDSIDKALGYIRNWGRQSDIKWVADKLRFKKVDELELLATVDMAICDLTEAEIPISVDSIKHLIATNKEWRAKLKRQTFSDANIARAIKELQTLLQGGNQP
jgi:type I restriction enzyme S subunit